MSLAECIPPREAGRIPEYCCPCSLTSLVRSSPQTQRGRRIWPDSHPGAVAQVGTVPASPRHLGALEPSSVPSGRRCASRCRPKEVDLKRSNAPLPQMSGVYDMESSGHPVAFMASLARTFIICASEAKARDCEVWQADPDHSAGGTGVA